jgi:hypothetical protein
VISVPCGLGRGSSKPDGSALYVRRIGERGPEGLHADRDQHVGGYALGVFDQIINDGKRIDIEYYYKLIEKRQYAYVRDESKMAATHFTSARIGTASALTTS